MILRDENEPIHEINALCHTLSHVPYGIFFSGAVQIKANGRYFMFLPCLKQKKIATSSELPQMTSGPAVYRDFGTRRADSVL